MPTDKPRGENRAPTYVSYSTFTTMIDWLKGMDKLPSRIDRSLWASKFSGSNGAQLVGGMRFLGLLNGDTPEPRLRELVRAGKDERKTLLEAMLREAYGDDIVDGLATMTPSLLDDKLAALGTTTATHRKAVSFFVNAVKATDVAIPGIIAKRARNRRAGAGRKTPAAQKKNNDPGTPKIDTPADEGTDGETTAVLRKRYVEMLMARAESSDELDGELLDRIEALLKFERITT